MMNEEDVRHYTYLRDECLVLTVIVSIVVNNEYAL
jgi:hypothetical protein